MGARAVRYDPAMHMQRPARQGLSSLSAKAVPALGGLLLALAALPQLVYPLWFDQGAFAACGATLRAGGVFLRDCWEVRGPLTPFLYALSMLLTATPVAIRVLDIAWQAGTALALGGLAGDLFGRTAGRVAALLYFLMYATVNYWATAQAEGFANLLFVGAVWLSWRATEGSGHRAPDGSPTTARLREAALAGLAAGLLFWSKYPFALITVPLLGWVGLRGGLRAGAGFAAGVAGGLGLGLAYFAFTGTLVELGQHLTYAVSTFHDIPLAQRAEWLTGIFWEEVRASATIGNTPTAGYKATVVAFDDILGRGYPFIMGLTLIGAISALVSTSTRRAGALALIYWGVTVALQVWQGHSYRYHFIVTLPPFALLAAASVRGWDVDPTPTPRRRWLAGLPLLAVLLAVIGMGAAIFPWTRDAFVNLVVEGKPIDQIYRESRQADYVALSDFLRDKTSPAESSFVFGDVPAVYAFASRPMGARFPYLRWAREGGDRAVIAAYTQQLLDDLRARTPRFFILPKIGMPSNDFDFTQIWKDMTPVHDYVEAAYAFVGEVGPFIVFQRK